jgi:hypothetical protein
MPTAPRNRTLLFAALAATAVLAAGTTAARDCRPVEPQLPGVRLPPTPGCPPPGEAKPASVERPKAGRDPGFIDLGGGTTVRVGGQVRGETRFGR